jgi:hypothetical protein
MAGIDIGKSVGVGVGTGVELGSAVSVGVGETMLTCGAGSGMAAGTGAASCPQAARHIPTANRSEMSAPNLDIGETSVGMS